MEANYFAELNSVNVSEHIEKKGRFSYLSWPFAVAELKKRWPDATWEVRRFDGLPYQKTDLGYLVEVAVTVNGVTHSQIHPVLDGSNKPHSKPTVFDINTSIQRCVVKAIALHGLGLYIYAGEDLPEPEPKHPLTPKESGVPITTSVWEEMTPEQQNKLTDVAMVAVEHLSDGDTGEAVRVIDDAGLDNEEKMALWTRFDSKQRSALKRHKNIEAMKGAIEPKGDDDGL